MSYRVKVFPQAEQELFEIFDYTLVEYGASTLERYDRRLEEVRERLRTTPMAARLIRARSSNHSALRAIELRAFLVIYRIDETEKVVEILTVRYTRQDLRKLLESL